MNTAAAKKRVLQDLKAFVLRFGSQRLYTVMLEQRRHDLVNSIQFHFQTAGNRQGVSALSYAMALLKLEYLPACDRSTTYEDDLDALHALYCGGVLCTQAGLQAAGQTQLFHRAKKRSGRRPGWSASWSSVYAHMIGHYGPLEWRRFLGCLPEGAYELPDGRVRVFPGIHRGENPTPLFVSAIKDLIDLGYGLSPSVMSSNHLTFNLHRRIGMSGQRHGFKYKDIVESATGRSYRESLESPRGSKLRSPKHHVRCLERLDIALATRSEAKKHPYLRSLPEQIVDDFLAELLGSELYERSHVHEVSYAIILQTPVESLSSLPTPMPYPYTARGRPTCDVVILGTQGRGLCLEISGGDLSRKKSYLDKINWKRSTVLKYRPGWEFSFITFDVGRWGDLESQLKKLCIAISAIGVTIAKPIESLRQILERVKIGLGQSGNYFSYDDAQEYCRKHGITGMNHTVTRAAERSYLEVCKTERRLPSNPHSIYKDVWAAKGGSPGFFGPARDDWLK